jgi:putative membrane protein
MNDRILSLCLATQPAVTPDGVWSAWSLAPQVVLPLSGASLLYAHGWCAGRVTAEDRDPQDTRAWFFLAGMLALAVAVVSPLCRLAAELAWAHMVQHVLLVAVAPPLILLGCPLDVVTRNLPGLLQGAKWLRRHFPQSVVSLICSTVLYGVTIWFWHIPASYQGALLSEAVHLVLYATLLGASFWFWNAVLHGIRTGGGQLGAGIAALFVSLLQTGLLAVLLTLSPRPWYPLMSQNSAAWGHSPLEDQQLAGLIMWVPMSFIYLGAALALAARWIGGTQGAAERKA